MILFPYILNRSIIICNWYHYLLNMNYGAKLKTLYSRMDQRQKLPLVLGYSIEKFKQQNKKIGKLYIGFYFLNSWMKITKNLLSYSGTFAETLKNSFYIFWGFWCQIWTIYGQKHFQTNAKWQVTDFKDKPRTVSFCLEVERNVLST